MSYHLLRLVVCVLQFAGQSAGQSAAADVYNRSSEGLTTFPSDIPENTTDIILVNNSISAITSIQSLPNVTLINLAKNNLSTVPDLSKVGDTLETLILDENIISQVPIDNILPLKSLSTLSLLSNLVTRLPNFGLLPPAPALDIILQGDEQIICDWRMAAIKRAEAVGKVTFSSGKPNCVAPPSVAGTSWAAVTVADMTAIGNDTANYASFGRFDASSPMSTYPTVEPSLSDVDTPNCARLCLRSPGCTMMSSDGSTCVLTTNTVAGSGPLPTPHNAWNIRL